MTVARAWTSGATGALAGAGRVAAEVAAMASQIITTASNARGGAW